MPSNFVVIDTEFTSFSNAKLWSIGAVCAGRWFYGEISPDSQEGKSLYRESSDFVKEAVLPQFGKVPDCSFESLTELGMAFGAWLAAQLNLSSENPAIFLFDSEHDSDLAREALRHGGRFKDFSCFKFVNVSGATAVAVAQMVMEDYLESSALKQAYGIRAHHALLDAYALQAGVEVVSVKG